MTDKKKKTKKKCICGLNGGAMTRVKGWLVKTCPSHKDSGYGHEEWCRCTKCWRPDR